MNPIVNWSEDGFFDGALLFDGSDYRSRDNIIAFLHSGDRLGLLRDRGGYYRAEFLHKVPSLTFSVPVWDDSRSSTMCGSVAEGEALIAEFVGAQGAA